MRQLLRILRPILEPAHKLIHLLGGVVLKKGDARVHGR
jgi:hypothetical protein